MRVDILFMQAKGSLSADLPEQYSLRPQGQSVLVGFGGARSIGYNPRELTDANLVAAEFVHLYDIQRNGATISLYRRDGVPITHTAVWQLDDGIVTTFMDEPAAYLEALEAVVRKIDIEPRGPAVPRIHLNGELKRGDTRDPTYRDELQFRSASASVDGFPVVRFREEPKPPKVAFRGVESDPRYDLAYEVLPIGVRVEAAGPPGSVDELEREVEAVVQTVDAR